MNLNCFAGCYVSPESKGIFQFPFDEETGRMGKPALSIPMPDCKFLSCYDGFISSTYCQNGASGVALLSVEEQGLTYLSRQQQGKVAPCFVGFFGDLVISANYHEGTVFLARRKGETLVNEKTISIGEKAGCHQALVHGKFLLIPCLELDCIRLFDLQNDCADAGEIPFPKGSGPRHGVFDKEHRRFWVVGERDNRLYCFTPEEGNRFARINTLDIVEGNASTMSQSAAIKLSLDERFLVVSTRGANLLTVFDITGETPVLIGQYPCGGDGPRDFCFSPDGRFILVANQHSGEVVSFSFDQKSGVIGPQAGRITIEHVVSIVFSGKENPR